MMQPRLGPRTWHLFGCDGAVCTGFHRRPHRALERAEQRTAHLQVAPKEMTRSRGSIISLWSSLMQRWKGAGHRKAWPPWQVAPKEMTCGQTGRGLHHLSLVPSGAVAVWVYALCALCRVLKGSALPTHAGAGVRERQRPCPPRSALSSRRSRRRQLQYTPQL